MGACRAALMTVVAMRAASTVEAMRTNGWRRISVGGGDDRVPSPPPPPRRRGGGRAHLARPRVDAISAREVALIVPVANDLVASAVENLT